MQGFDNTSKYFGKTIILCNTLSFCKDLPSFSLEYFIQSLPTLQILIGYIWNTKNCVTPSVFQNALTSYAVHDPKSGSLLFILVDHAFLGRLGNRDGHCDGSVEPPASWFQGDDGTDCHAVSKQLGHQVWGNWLSLFFDRIRTLVLFKFAIYHLASQHVISLASKLHNVFKN